MTHARTQIRNAFVTSLELISWLTIYNGRVFPLHDGVLPAATVYSRSETIDEEQGKKFHEQFRSLILSVQCYAKIDEELDNELDRISEAVEVTIFADSQIKTLVRCLDLSASDIEVSQEGENPMGTITLSFLCKYITDEGNPGVIKT